MTEGTIKASVFPRSLSSNTAFPHLTHPMFLHAKIGLLVPSQSVEQSVHPCDGIHNKHDDLEDGKEDVKCRLTIVPTQSVSIVRVRYLILQKGEKPGEVGGKAYQGADDAG